VVRLAGAEVAAAVGGRLVLPTLVSGRGVHRGNAEPHVKVEVSGPVVADSRQATEGCLFVAIKGERVDGHEYAAEAHAAGAALVLADRPIAGVPCVVVDDTVMALGRLAFTHIQRLGRADRGPVVVAVTGSSGKTSTKDLLAQVLAVGGPTVAPPGSYNTEVGVPLTVLRADEATRYLVLEMGARGRGHIAYLCGIAPPRAGIVLNVGLAHAGEFGTRRDTAAAKSELVQAVPADGLVVLNADDELVAGMRALSRAPVVTFGASGEVRAREIRLDDRGRPAFTLVCPAGQAPTTLRLHGRHHVGNALAVAATATRLGMDVGTVAAALGAATAASRWRMEVTDRPDGVTVINDAYNANPDSVRAALEALVAISAGSLEQAPAGRRRRSWAVLGEMLELGPRSVEEHQAVGRLAGALGVDRVVAVGPGAEPIHRGAAGGSGEVGAPRTASSRAVASVYVPNAEAAVTVLEAELRPGDVLLVKASRGVGLERVADAMLASRTRSEEDAG
jgi:UDP-N-acetylmuramoyl-tripeptide--D-alanyl-D-alanine ligase